MQLLGQEIYSVKDLSGVNPCSKGKKSGIMEILQFLAGGAVLNQTQHLGEGWAHTFVGFEKKKKFRYKGVFWDVQTADVLCRKKRDLQDSPSDVPCGKRMAVMLPSLHTTAGSRPREDTGAKRRE